MISRYGCVLALALPAIAVADDLHYEITPYLWGAGLTGNTAAEGVGTPVDTDYSFFALDNLEAVASMVFSAQSERWGLELDGLYLRYGDEFSNQLLDTDVTLSGGFFEAAGSYRLQPDSPWEVLAGARYVAVDVELDLTPGPAARQDKSWVDPIIGVRFNHEFSPKLFGQLRADVGGFGVASERATNLMGVLGFRVSKRTTVKLGYRYLNVDFEEDSFIYDITIKGIVVGVGIAL